MSFLAELKRRNVFRVAVLYLVAGWGLLQVADLLDDALSLPEWSLRLVLLLLALGFPLALIFSWIYELTPQGLKLESAVDQTTSITHKTGRRIDVLIVLLLGAAIALIVADRLIPERATVSSTMPSIAVLPFVNMSADPENEYFSDGLSEELLNLLAQIPELEVAARTSAFSFKDKEMTVPEIADALHVDHVLEGSVRKSGNEVRITAQLIAAANGNHLWSKTYDRTLADIFKVQDEIAAAVVSELKLNLLGTPQVQPTDPQAYALYLRANYFRDRRSKADLEHAVDDYRRALDIAADYAPAWAGLARAYAIQADNGFRPVKPAYEQARAAALRSLDLDPELALGHGAMGWIQTSYDWDWAAADESFRQALALAPNDVRILNWYGALAITLGKVDEAIELDRRALSHDPMQVTTYYDLGLSLYYAGRLDEAEHELRQAIELNPEQPGTRFHLGCIALARGDPAAAMAEFEAENSPWRLVGLPLGYHALGRRAESDAALNALKDELAEGAAVQIAEVHAFRGELDDALAWLDKAYAQRDSGLSEITRHPLLASLEQDPRYRAFLEKMKLPVD